MEFRPFKALTLNRSSDYISSVRRSRLSALAFFQPGPARAGPRTPGGSTWLQGPRQARTIGEVPPAAACSPGRPRAPPDWRSAPAPSRLRRLEPLALAWLWPAVSPAARSLTDPAI